MIFLHIIHLTYSILVPLEVGAPPELWKYISDAKQTICPSGYSTMLYEFQDTRSSYYNFQNELIARGSTPSFVLNDITTISYKRIPHNSCGIVFSTNSSRVSVKANCHIFFKSMFVVGIGIVDISKGIDLDSSIRGNQNTCP